MGLVAALAPTGPSRSAQAGAATAAGPAQGAVSLVLLTLDTTRADHLGCYGAASARTPRLDALARRGTRFARALTPSPLTLPAHASLLTGLDPPAHGVRDNGTAVLPAQLPTLATVLGARGYATAAFVSSRVLDRRFGLARGFDVYDDRMPAEQLGEYGYPERDAEAVAGAALEWLAARRSSGPFFLWVHFYDPHAPYAPPGVRADAPERERYAAEIAFVDRQVGRLLDALPAGALVGAVGDHGEMLGEHGERAHGVFLYRASLEVPLILAGPGVPAGHVVARSAGTRALAATLLRLLRAGDAAAAFGAALPGLPVSGDGRAGEVVYSETLLPASAYGWSALAAVSDERWRFIRAPRAELYDFVADPGETRNLLGQRAAESERLRRALERVQGAATAATAPPADAELAASLRSLGYLSGMSGAGARIIDPKDGIGWLAEFEQAKSLLRAGRAREALASLDRLVRRNPDNVPFLARLAEAQLAAGRGGAAVATLQRALALNPRLDFLHLELGAVQARLGRDDDARRAYERALDLNPRLARAALGLAELALKGGRAGDERRILTRAEAAGSDSAAILTRLAQLDLAAGDLDAAERRAQRAAGLVRGFAAAHWVWGQVLEQGGRTDAALERYSRAVELNPSDASALLHVGRLLARENRVIEARPYLERAVAAAGRGQAGQEARRLLQALARETESRP